MANSGATRPKPLVEVRGVTLLERNLAALLGAGVREIVVAVPSHTSQIKDFVLSRGRRVAEAFAAQIAVFEEVEPLGNIGAARNVTGLSDDLLVVYADNLTTLNLADIVEQHRRKQPALTSATHLESVQAAYGEVEIDVDRIVAYHEKPIRQQRIASGVYVLAPAARECIAPRERLEISRLVNRLLTAKMPVASYAHDAPWIDVNDAVAKAQAEALIAKHSSAFELWNRTPDAEQICILVCNAKCILLESHTDLNQNPLYELPGRALQASETPQSAADREMLALFDNCGARALAFATFDDLDWRTGRVLRHHVFTVDNIPENVHTAMYPSSPGRKFIWAPLVVDQDLVNSAVIRTIAILRQSHLDATAFDVRRDRRAVQAE